MRSFPIVLVAALGFGWAIEGNALGPGACYETQLRSSVARREVAEITAHPPSGRLGRWDCASGSCFPFSRQLSAAFPEGSDVAVYKASARGPTQFRVHYYLVEGPPGPDEIIVDPTYLQFFIRPWPDADRVFVGTRAELAAVFKRHDDSIHPEWADLAPEADPAALVAKIYGWTGSRAPAPPNPK